MCAAATDEAINESQMQTTLQNGIVQTARKTVYASYRVNVKPFEPSGPRGCRITLTLHVEDSLLLLTASVFLLGPNLLTKTFYQCT